jgi:hypothetical protein
MAKDLFSTQASGYAKYRPTYPPELFEYILSFVEEKNFAWDFATGNGQAAVELAPHFRKVYATDISSKQLEQAIPVKNIEYAVASEQTTDIPENTIDLITVAQAYHWFDFDGFYREAVRVSHAKSVVAVWGYSMAICEDEVISKQLDFFYRQTVGHYWDPERKHVDAHYSTVSFPFDELGAPEFKIHVDWNREDFIGYLNTWSSVQNYIKVNKSNPVDEFAEELRSIWPDDATRHFYFPLFLRIGNVY